MKAIPSLRRQQDLDTVFEEGHWRRLRGAVVGVYLRDDDRPTRLAVVAGRRIGTAVRRNRARRRMREAIRGFADEIRPGADIVLLAREATVEVDFRLLQTDIRQALEAEGLLDVVKAEDQPR